MDTTSIAPQATDFGAFIKYIREQVYKESTRAFATRIRLSPGYLNRIELGRVGIPRRDTVERIASRLDIDGDTLLLKAGYAPDTQDTMQEAQLIAFKLSRMSPEYRNIVHSIIDVFTINHTPV